MESRRNERGILKPSSYNNNNTRPVGRKELQEEMIRKGRSKDIFTLILGACSSSTGQLQKYLVWLT